MLVIPAFQARMQSALIRANNKPPLEVVVANQEHNRKKSDFMLTAWIDTMTPCLKDTKTCELVDTEVIRIKRASFLRKYSKKNGWYVSWNELLKENEVYALVIHGSVDIQGLLAVRPDESMASAFVTWMCASPENNPEDLLLIKN